MTRALTLTVLALLLTATTGCETIGYVANAVAGEQDIPAAFELPATSTLVIVEDPQGKLTSPDLATRIASRVSDELAEREIGGQVIPTGMLNRFISETPDYHDTPENWPIDKIGRQVGADQVIYVVIQSFRLTEDNAIYRPVAEVRVKVVDVASGKRLFPTNTSEGYPVITSQFYRSMEGGTGTTHNIISRQLSEELAQDIAKLFYSHAPYKAGDRLPG